MIRRRSFITLIGCAAAWPLAARAQQGTRVRRIGVLGTGDENELVAKAYASAFAELGWTVGRNVRMDLRWGGTDITRIRALAQELVGLQPDIILANTTSATVAVLRETRTIPIVFAGVADPRRQRHCPSPQPAGREHHRLRRLGSLDGRQVA